MSCSSPDRTGAKFRGPAAQGKPPAARQNPPNPRPIPGQLRAGACLPPAQARPRGPRPRAAGRTAGAGPRGKAAGKGSVSGHGRRRHAPVARRVSEAVWTLPQDGFFAGGRCRSKNSIGLAAPLLIVTAPLPGSAAHAPYKGSRRVPDDSIVPPPAGAGSTGWLRNMTTAAVRPGGPDVTFLGSNEYRRQALTGRSATLPFAAGCLR